MKSDSIDKKKIKSLLPHREPMLLIDSLINIVHLKSATAIVKVMKNSFFVQGHFPGQPVMPGVFIVEAFGQAAAALTAYGVDSKEYEKILIQLALEIGINENIVQVLNDDIKSKEFLKKYLTKMGYKQTNTKSRIGYKISHTETIRLVKVSIFLLNTYGIKFFLKKMIIKLKNSI